MSRSMGVCLILLVEEGAGGESVRQRIFVFQMAASAERACRIAVPFYACCSGYDCSGHCDVWLVGWYLYVWREVFFLAQFDYLVFVLWFGGTRASLTTAQPWL